MCEDRGIAGSRDRGGQACACEDRGIAGVATLYMQCTHIVHTLDMQCTHSVGPAGLTVGIRASQESRPAQTKFGSEVAWSPRCKMAALLSRRRTQTSDTVDIIRETPDRGQHLTPTGAPPSPHPRPDRLSRCRRTGVAHPQPQQRVCGAYTHKFPEPCARGLAQPVTS